MNRIEPKDFSKRDLQQAMSEASADSVSDLHTHRESILMQYRSGRELRGIQLPWPSTHSLLRLSKGLSVLCGINGHYKSTIASQILLFAAQRFKVGLISLEMEIADIAEVLTWQSIGAAEKPGFEHLNNLLKWTIDRFYVFDHLGSLDPLMALGAVDAMARQGCKLIVLDSMMMTRVSDDQEKEREFTQALVGLARLHEVHIMLVFRGSGAIVDVASLAIVCWHNKKRQFLERKAEEGGSLDRKEKAYIQKSAPFLLCVIKNRHSAFEGPITLYRKGLSFYDNDKFMSDFGNV